MTDKKAAPSNVDHRTKSIRDALERMYQCDKEIEALMEQHIASLREEKRDIKKRMREEFDVPTKRFNGRYAQYREERRAIENRDDAALDAIKYLYGVAPIGEQMDWLTAVGADEDGDDPRPQFLKDKSAGKEAADAGA